MQCASSVEKMPSWGLREQRMEADQALLFINASSALLDTSGPAPAGDEKAGVTVTLVTL